MSPGIGSGPRARPDAGPPRDRSKGPPSAPLRGAPRRYGPQRWCPGRSPYEIAVARSSPSTPLDSTPPGQSRAPSPADRLTSERLGPSGVSRLSGIIRWPGLTREASPLQALPRWIPSDGRKTAADADDAARSAPRGLLEIPVSGPRPADADSCSTRPAGPCSSPTRTPDASSPATRLISAHAGYEKVVTGSRRTCPSDLRTSQRVSRAARGGRQVELSVAPRCEGARFASTCAVVAPIPTDVCRYPRPGQSIGRGSSQNSVSTATIRSAASGTRGARACSPICFQTARIADERRTVALEPLGGETSTEAGPRRRRRARRAAFSICSSTSGAGGAERTARGNSQAAALVHGAAPARATARAAAA